jgi:hypothetical protein
MIYLSYGDYPLPSRGEALAAPLRAFRSWLLRLECARCKRGRYLAETHMKLGLSASTAEADIAYSKRNP